MRNANAKASKTCPSLQGNGDQVTHMYDSYWLPSVATRKRGPSNMYGSSSVLFSGSCSDGIQIERKNKR